MGSELVWITKFPDAEGARRAQARLDAQGIHSVIADESAGAGPELRYFGGVRLGVREADAKAARLILKNGGGA